MCQTISASRGSGVEEDALLSGCPHCLGALTTSSRDTGVALYQSKVFPSTSCLQVQVFVCYEALMAFPVSDRKKNTLLGGHELMEIHKHYSKLEIS